MKTYSAKPHEIERRWFIVDATDQVWDGWRHASQRSPGQAKPAFTPHTDVGDFVIVVNAEKVKLTGASSTRNSSGPHGLSGGSRRDPYRRLLETHPERAIEQASGACCPRGAWAAAASQGEGVQGHRPPTLLAEAGTARRSRRSRCTSARKRPGKRKQKPKKTKPAAEATSKAKPARKATKRKPTVRKSKPKAPAAKTEQANPKRSHSSWLTQLLRRYGRRKRFHRPRSFGQRRRDDHVKRPSARAAHHLALQRVRIVDPLRVAGVQSSYSVVATVKGGGPSDKPVRCDSVSRELSFRSIPNSGPD